MSASFDRTTFEIAASTGAYTVTIETGMVSGPPSGELRSMLSAASVIADRFFFEPGLPSFAASHPIWIEATEYEKSLDRAPALIERMRAAGANRSTPLVAVGGGVIQDISAFVASVYMRGLSWSYVPTTVLAMVDSCIGGKSSINVGPYKNLVGTFHPPEHIYIDPALAESLPRDQFASGLIEAAKICFCRGEDAFNSYLACGPAVDMPTSQLRKLVETSLLAKKHFIEIDEFDKKERLLLNFGHTFGHAIEGASNYGIPHGIAVGIGILCSLAFQRGRGVRFDGVPRVTLFEASDKKHSADRYTLILVNGSGEVQLERMDRTPKLQAALRSAIATTLESYTLGSSIPIFLRTGAYHWATRSACSLPVGTSCICSNRAAAGSPACRSCTR